MARLSRDKAGLTEAKMPDCLAQVGARCEDSCWDPTGPLKHRVAPRLFLLELQEWMPGVHLALVPSRIGIEQRSWRARSAFDVPAPFRNGRSHSQPLSTPSGPY